VTPYQLLKVEIQS